jgi:hypothetical protein
MGLFAKAKVKSVETKAPKKKATVWLAGTSAENEAVGNAIHEMVQIQAQLKALEAKMDLHKRLVKNHADAQFYQAYASAGVFPETPMQVQNKLGEKVTFVVQDRSSQSKVSEEQKEALAEFLGEDAVDQVLYDESRISFNRDVLSKPGVSERVEQALEQAIQELHAEGLLNEDDELIDATVTTTFRPGLLDRLGMLFGKDVNRIRTFVELMGSACVRYVRC